MSPDELAATEVRRRSREADQRGLMALTAIFEPGGGSGPAVAREVIVRIAPGATQDGADNLKISQGSSFHETIILAPAVYRLIAGGLGAPAPANAPPAQFVVAAGGPGYDRVTLDRQAFAALVARERPVEMTRARRLVALDRETGTPSPRSIERQVAAFEKRWAADLISIRIDAAVARNASRAILLMAGKDHVALWVTKEDLTSGSDCILGSPLAAAIVRPDRHRPRSAPVKPIAPPTPDRAPYLQSTFGSGPERRLILDLGHLRKAVPALSKDEQDQALVLFDRLIERCLAIGQDRALRLAKSRRMQS